MPVLEPLLPEVVKCSTLLISKGTAVEAPAFADSDIAPILTKSHTVSVLVPVSYVS